MNIFRFKRFSVSNELSAMKVNTDGVLLGAAVTIPSIDLSVNDGTSCFRILDIGTGTGCIALMLAQRLSDAFQSEGQRTDRDIKIIGIDIDQPSAEEAAANFAASPWSSSLKAIHTSLDTYHPDAPLNLIVSNPPFFENSLTAPDTRRSAARHVVEGLSYKTILEFATEDLATDGLLAMILPADQEDGVLRHGRCCSLFPSRILRICTSPRHDPSRVVIEFSRKRFFMKSLSGSQDSDITAEETLTIQAEGHYTPEYKALTQEFYL